MWGFVGSSTARFSSFVRGPRRCSVICAGAGRGIGHTPLGALSILALLAAVAVQVGLGLISQDEDGLYAGPLATLVSSDTSDKARDIHELWFNVVLALIVLHVAAIVYYRFRGRQPDQADDHRQGDARPRRRADAARQMVGRADLPGRRLGITRWVVAGAPPFGP